MNGKTPDKTMTSKIGRPVVDEGLFIHLATTARWCSGGAMDVLEENGPSATPLDTFPISIPGKCAFLFGSIQEYVRLSGMEIPKEVEALLSDAQEEYRDGMTVRYSGEEIEGAEYARSAWASRTGRTT